MPTRTKAKSCEGKVRHASKAAAKRACIAARRRGGTWPTSYQCKFCGGWHIGHTPRRRWRS